MTTNARTIMGDYSVERALGAIEHDEFSGYPVIDRQGRCLGLTTLARLRRVAAEGGGESSVAELVRLKEYVYPDDALLRAVLRMNAMGTRQLPVVTQGDHSLAGIISMSDIFRVQADAAGDAEPSRPSASG